MRSIYQSTGVADVPSLPPVAQPSSWRVHTAPLKAPLTHRRTCLAAHGR